MQLDSLGNRVAEYTYYPGADNPESVRRHDRGDTTYYYLRDNPGRIVALLKKSGANTAIANRYDYDPFGVAQGSTITVPDPLQYAGREYDAETQLYYNRARYYDPGVGRFVSEDPAGLGAGINPYLYGGNDPVNNGDPSGMYADPDGMNQREWNLARQHGSVVIGTGSIMYTLVDLNGMLDDIAMVGKATTDKYCDASGCRQRYIWQSPSGWVASPWQGSANGTPCDIHGGGWDANGPNCSGIFRVPPVPAPSGPIDPNPPGYDGAYHAAVSTTAALDFACTWGSVAAGFWTIAGRAAEPHVLLGCAVYLAGRYSVPNP